MAEPLRTFTPQGIQAFLNYLGELRAGSKAPPDEALLRHSAWTRRAPGDIQFKVKHWQNRLEAVKDLAALLSAFSPTDLLLRDPGLWAWLSLAHFDVVCPVREDGTHTPGMDYRHIPSDDQRHHHRHLLKGPFDVYTRYGDQAVHLLQGQVYQESSLYHEVVGRQDLIANPAVVGLTRSLDFDESRQNLKNNAVDSKAPPGSIRRLVAVLMQLDLTYDLHRMSEKDLFALLPQREFGPWMSAQSDPSPAGQAKLPNPDKVTHPLTKANHR